MLFTRCPACDTTFRVTDEALTKAGGQVRCGRCAGVFNANTELRETLSPEDAAAPASAPKTAVAPKIEAPRSRAAVGDEAYDELSVAAVIAQVKLSNDELPPEQPEDFAAPQAPVAGSIDPIQRVLEQPVTSATAAIWALENPTPATPASNRWRFGALLAVLALGVQGIHHFRSDLAGNSVIGPWVQQTYGMFGAPVSPRWDIGQYQILDWIASAEPTRGQGGLQITARIHNRGPQAQPYPRIHLQLRDRWDETVGSRIFTPAEYLRSAATTLMRAGEIAQAQLEIVDPGPDAYGFELDVCVEVETDVVTCGNDAVFL